MSVISELAGEREATALSLVVLAMAAALFGLGGRFLTPAEVLFTLVLLIPSVVVDLLVLLGPKPGAQGDLLGRYRTRRAVARRRK